MNKFLLYSILFLFSSILSAQNKEDKYNLKFTYEREKENAFKWYTENSLVYIDSTQIINEKSPLCLKFVVPERFRRYEYDMPERISIYQTLFLPENISGKTITLDITSKCLNLEKLFLKIIYIDPDEKIIKKDSISINNENKWGKESLISTIPESAMQLNIKIEGRGLPKALEQAVWLDKIKIEIEKENINELSEKQVFLPNEDIVTGKDSIELLCKHFYPKLIGDKKIIAFGETIHGSETVCCYVFNAIKESIENDKCKLVLLEIPMDLSFRWNLYVKGLLPEETISEIDEELYTTVLSKEIISSFLAWLRDYNKNLTDKVNIMGLDNSIGSSIGSLEDCVWSLYETKGRPDKIVPILLALGQKESSDLLKLIETNKDFEDLFEAEDYKMYISILNQEAIDLSPANLVNFDYYRNIKRQRDKRMWQNMKNIIQIYNQQNEQIILYAHYLHINKLNLFPYDPEKVSLGYYISQHFGKDYYPISLIVGEGDITLVEFDEKGKGLYKKYALDYPPANSIEYICSNTFNQLFFCPSKHFKNSNLLVRLMGTIEQNRDRFYYNSISSRVDGIVFIPTSTENKYIDNSSVFMNELSYKRYDIRRNKRKELKNNQNK